MIKKKLAEFFKSIKIYFCNKYKKHRFKWKTLKNKEDHISWTCELCGKEFKADYGLDILRYGDIFKGDRISYYIDEKIKEKK